EADLSGADLRKARLSVSNLHDAKLIKARLAGASLVGSTLRNADLSQADLEGCKARGADARGASFFQARLKGIQLQQSNLSGARLSQADLSDSDLSGTQLAGSDLVEAKLQGASLRWANLDRASLRKADLTRADCRNAHFYRTNLQEASLQDADLSGALLIEANLDQTNLQGCRIAGLVVRDVPQAAQAQGRLLLSPPGEPSIQLESLQVAQFVQTLVMSSPMKGLLDSARSRLVPVIGRFSGDDERVAVGNSLWEAVQERGLVPVLVDWPEGRREDLPEMVSALAAVAACIVVDWSRTEGLAGLLTPLLAGLPSVPVQPLLQGAGQDPLEHGPLSDSERFLELIRYESCAELLDSFRSASLAAPVS
ncbi:MAG: pentapeptide repeat-containing protein, partial [Acidobacteriota bacterium]